MDPRHDAPAIPPARARADAVVRVLKRHRQRLQRKLDAMRGDLAEAERAPLYRKYAETLLTYFKQVPGRAQSVSLPDPAEPAHTLEIPLDVNLNAQGNATRYFRRAAKCERGLEEIPQRMSGVEAEVHDLGLVLDKAQAALEAVAGPAEELPREVMSALEAAAKALPPPLRAELGPAPRSVAAPRATVASVAKGDARAPSARLQPRRFKTAEGWDVLIGRNNEGNDYLTHHLARPEDYWFHVHGAPGSHVVLRRGKGKDEPSKATIQEVASWAAFFSQARTAGKVPVIVTQKKYVRKPRKGPPGLALCEREKTIIVRPVEPKTESESAAGESGEG